MRIVFENNHTPDIGKYKDTLVQDDAKGLTYFYDDCGTFLKVPTSGLPYTFHFINDDTLSITHNLNRYPSVTIRAADGGEIFGDVTFTSLNHIDIVFSEPLTGDVALN